MSKNKWIGIIALIIAVVVVIVVLDPFGDKIEGAWYLYHVEADGEVEDISEKSDMSIYTFSEDGTVTVANPAPSYYDEDYIYKTYSYSYSDGKMTADGDTFDCEINGDKMSWSGVSDGISIKAEFMR